MIVTFADEVRCGPAVPDDAIGCAPIPPFRETPTEIRIARGYADASVVTVLKHEFGHAPGLRHGTSDLAFMRAASDLTTLPQVDAVDRSNPWEQSNSPSTSTGRPSGAGQRHRRATARSRLHLLRRRRGGVAPGRPLAPADDRPGGSRRGDRVRGSK